jgi:hypothetical protein
MLPGGKLSDLLGSFDYRGSDIFWKICIDEALFWVEVIFTGFVYHSQLAMLCGICIGHGFIDFPLLQRRWIVGILDTNYEMGFAHRNMTSLIGT